MNPAYSTWTVLEKEQGTPISDMVVWIITIVDEIKGRGEIENIVIQCFMFETRGKGMYLMVKKQRLR